MTHPVGGKIDAVSLCVLAEIPEDIRELKGFPQAVGIGGETLQIPSKDGDANSPDSAGRPVAVKLKGRKVRDPDQAKVCLHSPDDIPIEGGRDSPAARYLDDPLEKGLGFPSHRGSEVVVEGKGPGRKVGRHIDLSPGFVGQVVDEAAEDIEIEKVLLTLGIEEREGPEKGASPDSGPGPFKSGPIEGQ
jgi:hypothetical protein